MLVIVMEKRSMVEERAYTKPAACLPSAQCNLELPAAARKSNLPFPVSPSGGKPGRAGSPHAAGTLCASQKRWHTSMPRLPPQEGFQSAPLNPPLRIPPDGAPAASRWSGPRSGSEPEKKIKDGRHVGLDLYDLLIEGV